ncbi:MAG: hypothetical protein M3R26_03135 [Actinomycetota bacterium]|nr:hypothetical protein [Actinomycetota bacterium]MDQ2981303.1 hypothetical protein [Actinomycetota bacterium]
MARDWLEKPDNPAMTEWGVMSEDVYGGIALLNFHEMAYKMALATDVTRWRPIEFVAQLEDLSWLDRAIEENSLSNQ